MGGSLRDSQRNFAGLGAASVRENAAHQADHAPVKTGEALRPPSGARSQLTCFTPRHGGQRISGGGPDRHLDSTEHCCISGTARRHYPARLQLDLDEPAARGVNVARDEQAEMCRAR